MKKEKATKIEQELKILSEKNKELTDRLRLSRLDCMRFTQYYLAASKNLADAQKELKALKRKRDT